MQTVRAQARRIHDEAILIDGHNDHFYSAWYRGASRVMTRVDRALDTDAPRLRRAGLTATFYMTGGWELESSLTMMEWALREIENRPDLLLQIRKTADLRRAKRTGRFGVMLSWESCNALMGRIEVLQAAYRLGLRATTLTYSDGGGEHSLQGTPLPTGYLTSEERESHRRAAKGLTPFGHEVVAEMNRLGVLIDVAHANDATIEDAVRLTNKPLVSSHGAAFALCPHARCSTDAQLRLIASTGGLIGIVVYTKFLAPPPAAATLNTMVDHLAYVADLVGIEHVAIGSDLGALGQSDSVVRTPADFVKLTETMLRRGFTPADVRKVWGGNYLRVLGEVIG